MAETNDTTLLTAQDDDFEFGVSEQNSEGNSDGTNDKETNNPDNEVADAGENNDKGTKEQNDNQQSGDDNKGDNKPTENSDSNDQKPDGDTADENGNEEITTENFFDKISNEEGNENEDGNELSIPTIASKLGIEAEDPDQFIEKINEKIDSAKQEVNLDEFNPDAQKVIKFLNENDGKIEDFFNNETITSLQGIIGLDPQTKIITVRQQELKRVGLNEEQIEEKIKEELESLSEREILNNAEKIDEQARELISNEISKLTSEREAILEEKTNKEKEKYEKSLNELKSYVMNQDEFMGIKLSDNTKKNIVQEIESGDFDKVINSDQKASRFATYMLQRYGKKITENFIKSLNEKNREGYNNALDKSTSALHEDGTNIKTSNNTGHVSGKEGQKKNFETWTSDLFEGE